MIFSKSFGYAVRGVLYITLMQESKQFVQVEEIAHKLAVPRYFMGKILKKLVKANMLSSAKGKAGGFTINDHTKQLSLVNLVSITDGLDTFHHCVLCLQECNAQNHCPVHDQMNGVRQKLMEVLSATTINDLLKEDKEDFIKSIATLYR